MTMVVSAKNGSIVAVTGSGIRFMSDSWIAFQPAIEEPSNIWPSANVFFNQRDVEGDMLPLAARVRETEIGVFHVVVFDHLHDVFSGSHGTRTFPASWRVVAE